MYTVMPPERPGHVHQYDPSSARPPRDFLMLCGFKSVQIESIMSGSSTRLCSQPKTGTGTHGRTGPQYITIP